MTIVIEPIASYPIYKFKINGINFSTTVFGQSQEVILIFI